MRLAMLSSRGRTVSLPQMLCLLALGASAFGCSAGVGSTDAGSGGASEGSGGSDSRPGDGGSGGAGGIGTSTTSTTGAFMSGGEGGTNGSGGVVCESGPTDDTDMDGFTGEQGDCNDCDANVNPAAVEVIPSPTGDDYVPADEDCDGTADNVAPPCDAGLALDTTDPMDGAKAIDLCKSAASDTDWGLVSAQWVRANGMPAVVPTLQTGVSPKFGSNVFPQLGSSLLVLSTGAARDAAQPGACGLSSCDGYGPGVAPTGFPQDVPGCLGDSEINDDVGLEVSVRAPSNATGYAFDFNFYSFEYPEYVCSIWNDQFIALVSPPPQGSINGNISFDSMNNPVSVNIAFFGVCTGCQLGTAELAGTGFNTWNDAGATSWLQTTAPVTPGETVTIRYTLWDTGDQALDSTVLVDNFRWIANGGTVSVGTAPVPQ
jgi:hypothetical protein